MHRTKGEGYLIPFLVGFVYSSVLAVATIVGMGRESFVSERVSLLLSLYSLAVALTGCGLLYWAYRRKPRDSQHWARLFTRAGVATLISVVMLVL